jgi:hypothetical protein
VKNICFKCKTLDMVFYFRLTAKHYCSLIYVCNMPSGTYVHAVTRERQVYVERSCFSNWYPIRYIARQVRWRKQKKVSGNISRGGGGGLDTKDVKFNERLTNGGSRMKDIYCSLWEHSQYQQLSCLQGTTCYTLS